MLSSNRRNVFYGNVLKNYLLRQHQFHYMCEMCIAEKGLLYPVLIVNAFGHLYVLGKI